MAKQDVHVFVSYARANKYLASGFLRHFKEQAGASKRHRYLFWTTGTSSSARTGSGRSRRRSRSPPSGCS